MGPAPFYGGRAENSPPPKKNADLAMKQTNICRLSGDITTERKLKTERAENIKLQFFVVPNVIFVSLSCLATRIQQPLTVFFSLKIVGTS